MYEKQKTSEVKADKYNILVEKEQVVSFLPPF